jgi:Papain family cysteine protease
MGSLEANAARREAYAAYTEYLASVPSDSVTNETIQQQDAIQYAQTVERQSFQKLNLSIQELIDCDTAIDLGCTGGNPLLAFYFMHRYGVASAETYPYTASEDTCQKKSANVPIATVKSWGILPPNSERHMELALRYIGPISVGFNGADPAFLSYTGGIFSNENCHHGSNHALLIVGYGEEDILLADGNTTRVPFWIARNSVRSRPPTRKQSLSFGLDGGHDIVIY